MINWAYVWPYFAGAFAAGYLIGSVPFGVVLARLAGLGDIRAIGSGNIGATNVLRAGSKPIAALTLVLDAGKGAVPVLIAARYFGPDIPLAVAAGAVVGHLFPVWLGFRGGKGVATALGVLLAIAWPVGVASCLTWLAVAALFRFSSLASIVALAAGPLYAWWLADVQSAEFAAFLAVIVIARHHANIRRLLKGGEPKIDLRRH